jgi:hypothetical protein
MFPSARPTTRNQLQGKGNKEKQARNRVCCEKKRWIEHASRLCNAHSPVLPSVVPLLHWSSAVPCWTAAVAFCASGGLRCVIWEVGSGEAVAFSSDSAHRTLRERICVDSCDDWVDAASGAGRARWVLREVVGGRVADCWSLCPVAVALEDFLCGDLSVV